MTGLSPAANWTSTGCGIPIGRAASCSTPDASQFFWVAHPLPALWERGKATLSRFAPTKSARQPRPCRGEGAFSTPVSVMDAGYQALGFTFLVIGACLLALLIYALLSRLGH